MNNEVSLKSAFIQSNFFTSKQEVDQALKFNQLSLTIYAGKDTVDFVTKEDVKYLLDQSLKEMSPTIYKVSLRDKQGDLIRRGHFVISHLNKRTELAFVHIHNSIRKEN